MTSRDYPGTGIVVHWDSERCFHSGRCVDGAPSVFDPRARPWVEADGLDADTLAAVIDTCPSGALSYTRTDGSPHGRRGWAEGADPTAALSPDEAARVVIGARRDPTGPPVADGREPADEDPKDADGDDRPPTTVITPRANGPLLVDGPVALTHPDGTTEVVDRVFLCRCGSSADKPRCDGSHKRVGFQAPGVPPTSRSPR